MSVINLLRKIGGDELAEAIREAIGSTEATAELLNELGVEAKGDDAPVIGIVEADEDEDDGLPDGRFDTGPSSKQPEEPEEPEDEEKGSSTFARQIEALSESANSKEAEFLKALATVVRRAKLEHYSVLASLLRTARGKNIAEAVDSIAAKMEQESGLAYGYPEPEEKDHKSAHPFPEDSLREELARLRQMMDELKDSLQKAAEIPVIPMANTAVTRPPSTSLPAATMLYRRLIGQDS